MLASICESLFNNFNCWKSHNLRILLPTFYYWRHRILWHFNPGMLQKQNMTLKNQVTLYKPVLLHLWRCNKLLLVIWIKFCLQEVCNVTTKNLLMPCQKLLYHHNIHILKGQYLEATFCLFLSFPKRNGRRLMIKKLWALNPAPDG